MNRSVSQNSMEGEFSFKVALKIIFRVGGYLRFFKARIAAKLGFITLEHFFRLLLLPWAL